MCASRTTGYQGFRSFAVQECPTLKPGETYEQRGTKFSKMGSSIVAPPHQNRVGRHSHESVVMQSGQLVQPADYRVPDRRGVSASEVLPDRKPFVATSTYLNDFSSFDAEMKRVLGVSLEQYEQAFQSLAALQKSLQPQVDGETKQQTVELADVPKVLKLALGDAAVPRVVDTFISYLDRRRGSQRDRITWDFFCQSVDHVDDLFEQELCARGKKRYSFSSSGEAVGSCRSPEGQHAPVPKITPNSSYLVDFGAYGANPRDRPYMRKRGMASTTSDLNPGTSRDTNQIPGYAGFLPLSFGNPQVVAHAHGPEDIESLHPTPRNTLRLFYSENIPGYAGHQPLSCSNYQGECRSGRDPNSTTGDSYRAHM